MSSSHGHYQRTAPIVVYDLKYSRDSSRTSQDSRSSTSYTDRHYSSSASSIRYRTGGQSVEQKILRVPDHENKRIITTSRGNVDVIHHQKGRYISVEPRSSDATHNQYHSSAYTSQGGRYREPKDSQGTRR